MTPSRMHPRSLSRTAVLATAVTALAVTVSIEAQNRSSRERFEGTAVVRVGDDEYTIPIECDDAARPELGFSTEPSRITRERTGRTSGVGLRLRSSGEPDEVVVSLNRYVAWLPQPASSGGTLSMQLDMSPATSVSSGVPVALTRDMWMDGDRPEGIQGVSFDAQCGFRDPEAPSFRRVP